LAVAAAGNLIVNCIDAWLEGDFGNPKPPPPPPSRIDIVGAAIDMQNTALNSYKNTFDLLTNQGFLTALFSNYGLLEAMGTIQFTYAPGDQITPAAVLRQNYDRSIWEQLLPRMFSWKYVPFTDGPSASTLPNFTFFIPARESARWQNQENIPPLVPPSNPYYSWDWVSNAWTGSARDAASAAQREVAALQSGQQFSFPGYDFTPNNWFGPGAISGPQPITGNSAHFYTISTNSHIAETPFYRHVPLHGPNNPIFVGFWKTNATLDGVTIQEWALETPDGKGGYLELSQDAANALFGAIPAGGLVPASPKLKSYTGGSYVDFQAPTGGLATRFDVFSNWGKEIPGFSPYSFQPPVSSGSMHVGLNPSNNYSQYFDNSYAYYKNTYVSKLNRRVGKTSSQSPGAGPRPSTVRIASRG
jgi:hypothetical protein